MKLKKFIAGVACVCSAACMAATAFAANPTDSQIDSLTENSDNISSKQQLAHGSYLYDFDTQERTYIPSESISYSSETSYSQYDPFTSETDTTSSDIFETYSINGTADEGVKIDNPQNDERCRNTVFIEAIAENGDASSFTGFMIASDAVLTCAHGFFDGTNTTDIYFNSVTVIPAKNSGSNPNPFGSQTLTVSASSCEYGADWSTNEADDWAILKLDKGFNIGWLGLQYDPWNKYNNKSVILNGYPCTSSDMYMHHGTVGKDFGDYFRCYDITTEHGESGGPCYYYSEKTGYTAIGILRGYSDQANGSTYAEVTKKLFNKILSYRS